MVEMEMSKFELFGPNYFSKSQNPTKPMAREKTSFAIYKS